MTRLMKVVAVGLLAVPAMVMADMKVEVNIGTDEAIYEGEYDDDESWFEEFKGCSPRKVQLEYQWCYHHGTRVIRVRKVFHPFSHNISYGPWELRFDLCHHNCHVPHKHHYVRSRHVHVDAHPHRGHYYCPRNEPVRKIRVVKEYTYRAPRYEEPIRRPPVRVTEVQVATVKVKKHEGKMYHGSQPKKTYRLEDEADTRTQRSNPAPVKVTKRVRVY